MFVHFFYLIVCLYNKIILLLIMRLSLNKKKLNLFSKRVKVAFNNFLKAT